MLRNEELELQIDLRRSLRAWRYYRDEKEDSYNLLKMYNDDMRGALEVLLRYCREAQSAQPKDSNPVSETQEKVEGKPPVPETNNLPPPEDDKEIAEPMDEFPKWMKQLYRDIAVKNAS